MQHDIGVLYNFCAFPDEESVGSKHVGVIKED